MAWHRDQLQMNVYGRGLNLSQRRSESQRPLVGGVGVTVSPDMTLGIHSFVSSIFPSKGPNCSRATA